MSVSLVHFAEICPPRMAPCSRPGNSNVSTTRPSSVFLEIVADAWSSSAVQFGTFWASHSWFSDSELRRVLIWPSKSRTASAVNMFRRAATSKFLSLYRRLTISLPIRISSSIDNGPGTVRSGIYCSASASEGPLGDRESLKISTESSVGGEAFSIPSSSHLAKHIEATCR